MMVLSERTTFNMLPRGSILDSKRVQLSHIFVLLI
jgi:hypothetical protein